jgi:hypothetical protein
MVSGSRCLCEEGEILVLANGGIIELDLMVGLNFRTLGGPQIASTLKPPA